MRKRQIIIITLLIISLLVVSLYQTLATDIIMSKEESQTADLSYTFDITDATGRIVNVKAGATKILDIFLTNSNNGKINYGVSYTPSTVKTDDIKIAQLSISKDKVSGLINKDELKQISIIIINNSSNNIELTLVPITGYEHGGDLIVPNNHTLITEEYEIELPKDPATIYIENIYNNAEKTKVTNNGTSYDIAQTVGLMKDANNNIRYYGNNPNNYIKFNNELWRIIGVFKDIENSDGSKATKLKIIKASSTLSRAFNNTANNEWSTATLNTYLNETFYNSLDSSYQKVISASMWNTGGFSAVSLSPKAAYDEERGTLVYNDTKKTKSLSKIALPYPSDYGYATDFSKCNKLLNGYNVTVCTNNDWLFLNQVQRMLTPRGDNTGGGTTINARGVLAFATTSGANIIRPTLYLKEDLLFSSGSGTSTDPYIIQLPPPTGAEYIESLLSNNKDTMNNDDPDNNVRYMGKDPNNYVKFNNELWRIIGVFKVKSSKDGQLEKRLKIIRNEPLGQMAWDSNNKNDWTKSSLQTYLNGEYYNSLTSKSQGQVGNTYWNIGGTADYKYVSNGLVNHWYNYERGIITYGSQPSTWEGKIGLMYPSDYGYATNVGGTTTNRASCLVKELYNWNNSSYSDCKNNDYLFNSSSYQWTITPLTSSSIYVFFVNDFGSINGYLANSSNYNASPVLYLNSSVTITGGTGTSTDPYTLG